MYWTSRVSLRNAGDRGANELLAVATTNDQGAFLAGADQQARLIGAHRNERVMAPQLAVSEADRLDQVAVIMVGDQVRDHLGVGLRAENRARLDQLVPSGRRNSRRSR